MRRNDKDWVEQAKKRAAQEAVKHVYNNLIVGLGSGSTAAYAIEEIGKKIKREKLNVLGVPTSYQALTLAVKHKIPITTLEEQPIVDLTIDGADQIDEELNLIKGMGAALLREKIVASASKKLVIVADERKKVKVLGENNFPVPIEVLSFAAILVIQKIKKVGGKAILRVGKKKVGPVITDNGNFIVDAYFGHIHEPTKLEQKLKNTPGIVETGLFIRMADIGCIGKHHGIETLLKK